MKIIAQKIKAARKALNLTQHTLARRAKLPDVYISFYERGERAPSVANLYKISRATGLSMDYFVSDGEQQLEMPRRGETFIPGIAVQQKALAGSTP